MNKDKAPVKKPTDLTTEETTNDEGSNPGPKHPLPPRPHLNEEESEEGDTKTQPND